MAFAAGRLGGDGFPFSFVVNTSYSSQVHSPPSHLTLYSHPPKHPAALPPPGEGMGVGVEGGGWGGDTAHRAVRCARALALVVRGRRERQHGRSLPRRAARVSDSVARTEAHHQPRK